MTNEQEAKTPERRWPQFSLRTLLVVMAVLALLFSYLAIAIRQAHEAANRTTCHGRRVNMLCMALQNYHDAFGCFPPAFVADENGKPMHSWRVLLLPHLERQDLYRRYDFSEPWDGPNNRLLRKEMPEVFRCPSSHGQDPFSTNYVAVVGSETAWPGGKSVSHNDIIDGPSDTLLIVEVADSDIDWMEPRDMTYSQAIAGVNVDRRHGISSDHPGGAICGMADCHSIFLPDDVPPAAIKALLTIHGDEPREVLSTVLHR